MLPLLNGMHCSLNPTAGMPQVAATCKHFYGYSFEMADGQSRYSFNARIDPVVSHAHRAHPGHLVSQVPSMLPASATMLFCQHSRHLNRDQHHTTLKLMAVRAPVNTLK